MTNILMNFDFSVDFSLTYCLLTVASFRIGVPSILFLLKFGIFEVISNLVAWWQNLRLVHNSTLFFCISIWHLCWPWIRANIEMGNLKAKTPWVLFLCSILNIEKSLERWQKELYSDNICPVRLFHPVRVFIFENFSALCVYFILCVY